MPELPEVETIKRELKPFVINKRISKVKIIRSDVIGCPSVRVFKKAVVGKKISKLSRKAKYLIFDLNNSYQIIVHLRLSGQLLVWKHKKDAPKHERIRFYLSNNTFLSFVEPRVLGRVYLVSKGAYPDVLKGLKNLGLEPIDKRFTCDYLASRLKYRKATIKSLLLNQSITAGVGNIYSDEALFLAGIHPLRRANTLSELEIKKLSQALYDVLHAGIKYKGTSVSDYLRPNGSEGKYQFRSYVFGREGEMCRICKTKIEFAKIGNRRTRFCPKCQPQKP